MKAGRDYSWYVTYEWGYEYPDPDTGGWAFYLDRDQRRFGCRKKDLKKAVLEHVKKYELAGEEYRNLSVEVLDAYMTTPEEI